MSGSRLSILARLVAEQAGQPTAGCVGSGSDGRILARDVLALGDVRESAGDAPERRSSALAREVARQAAVMLPTPGKPGRILARDLVPVEPAPELHGEMVPDLVPSGLVPARAPAPHDRESTDLIRRAAEGLAASRREAPQHHPRRHMTVRVRTDALEALRATLDAEGSQADGISLDAVLVKLAARALAETPALDAASTERGMARSSSVDVAVAIAVPAGLSTPVVRDAGSRRVGEISATLRALEAQARAGTLAREACEGGALTLSNLGMLGVDQLAAELDPPRAAILALGAAEPAPVAVDGAVGVARVMACTLSVNHRIPDGVAIARYLQAFEMLVEEPRRLLL